VTRIDDGFEATFVVDVPRGVAWSRLVARGAHDGCLSLPGFEGDVELADVDDGARLHGRKATEPCAGTEIVVVLEDEVSGTRITVTQSGFGGFLDAMGELAEVGWTNIVADLALALAHGVTGGRHLMPWGSLDAQVRTTPAGLAVDAVVEGGLAARLGLMAGDVLVALGGAPLATQADLVTVLRVIDGRPDVAIEAVWARDGERRVAACVPALGG
jgi:membrane-associated protease RseP (regulator of RpoE activity)